MNIILTNLEDIQSLMLYTQIQSQTSLCSEEEDFKWGF